jgi:NAD-reducing hydrogenase small subunit
VRYGEDGLINGAGCFGCHMSLLDIDEALIDVAAQADIVYGPLVDVKEYPPDVDVALVEGAVATDEQVELIAKVRERTRFLVSFGDCAVTGNVTSLRNPLGSAEIVLRRAYVECADRTPGIPREEGVLPVLLDRVRPLHEEVKIDLFLPGCPPASSSST